MKKVINLWLVSAALLMVAAGCAVTDIDRDADFTRYKTFTWGKSQVKVENPVYSSTLISKNIRRTVENEFAKRGIVADAKNPDFVVSFHTYTEEKQRTTGQTYGPFIPFRFYPYYWGRFPYGFNAPSTYSYTEGTLVLDIRDKKTGELVWRGAVSGNIDNVSRLQKQLNKGIKAIMKKYPVAPNERLLLYDEDATS